MKKIPMYPRLKYAAVLGCAVFLGSQAYAAPGVETKKAEKADTEAVKPANIILSVAAADWNRDKKPDAAVLLRGDGDQADLYLYLNNAKGGMELKLAKKNAIWTGAMAGTFPQLSTAKGGILFVDGQNEAIGRNRWSRRLTVDYRDNDFFVTGYTYSERDTLNIDYSLSCDVNLLTGNGTKNKVPVKIAPQKIKLSDWSDEKIPKECRN